MKRVREDLEATNNGGSSSQNNLFRSLDEEMPYPPLNLPLIKSPELIKEIESLLQEEPQQQQQSDESTTHPQKQKAMKFQISKITIGEWTREAINEQDLMAKVYFAKKKIMWECLDDVTTTGTTRLNRKIEIQWGDVLSFKETYHPSNQTGALKVELRKPPRFFVESNPESGKHTQWKQVNQDFTLNHSASRYRIQTIHFPPGVLQKNMKKLVSGDRFWSELIKVPFPTLQDLYFDIDYRNSNHIDFSSFSYGQTLSFSNNNDFHHYSQGFRRERVGQVNFNIATQFFGNQMRETNSYVEDNINNNTVNMLPATQVTQPSSQVMTESFNRERVFLPSGSQFCNPIFHDMSNTLEYLLGTQANAHTLLETQTNSIMVQHTNQPSVYSQQVGSSQEGERQNLEHTQLNGNFEINRNHQFGGYDYSQCISSNNGSVLPNIDNEDDSNE